MNSSFPGTICRRRGSRSIRPRRRKKAGSKRFHSWQCDKRRFTKMAGTTKRVSAQVDSQPGEPTTGSQATGVRPTRTTPAILPKRNIFIKPPKPPFDYVKHKNRPDDHDGRLQWPITMTDRGMPDRDIGPGGRRVAFRAGRRHRGFPGSVSTTIRSPKTTGPFCEGRFQTSPKVPSRVPT